LASARKKTPLNSLSVEQRGRNREEADTEWPDTNGRAKDVKKKNEKKMRIKEDRYLSAL
jgi:hypothetical protein